jgi:hypothetical protein
VGIKKEFYPEAERNYRVAQRVGWALLAVGLLLAVLGLFGNGIFTDTTSTASSEGIEVKLDYSRFARIRSPERIEIEINAAEAQGSLAITLSQEFADAVSLDGIVPEPDQTSISPDGPTYEWTVQDWSDGVHVSIDYKLDRWRTVDGRFQVEAGELAQSISFTQFVFP